MRDFNRALALSGASIAASIAVLGVCEYANTSYNDDMRACQVELDQKAEITKCTEALGADPDDTYGIVAFVFGAAGIFMGVKAYNLHEAQIARDENYRKAEGIDQI